MCCDQFQNNTSSIISYGVLLESLLSLGVVTNHSDDFWNQQPPGFLPSKAGHSIVLVQGKILSVLCTQRWDRRWWVLQQSWLGTKKILTFTMSWPRVKLTSAAFTRLLLSFSNHRAPSFYSRSEHSPSKKFSFQGCINHILLRDKNVMWQNVKKICYPRLTETNQETAQWNSRANHSHCQEMTALRY